MVHLFAALPASESKNIDVELGLTITWLTPHLLQQVVSDDVDIPTMLIFLQFYEFVNFRLYHSINLEYPPRLDTRLEAFAADLYALSRYANVTKPSGLIFEASQLDDSKQVEYKRKGTDGENEKSELRLSQLHHQLLSNFISCFFSN
ncbi:pescadillo amino-terminal protein [Medicago truncatula]|uniref:Pescadillo amino-terminal protein n=1 Tax=Medicago truncatula TaxID=3880 RepID=A0A072U6Q3_MEDTR|nr:pescadillo amino-terminal protein [Medicago truncatula]